MKRTFQWTTTFIVAAGLTALAQAPTSTGQAQAPGAQSGARSGQQVTVQGCLMQGASMTDATSGRTSNPVADAGSTGGAATGATSTGSTGSTGSSGSAVAGTQGATAQTGQAAGAGRTSADQASAGAMAGTGYILRVTDGGSGNARQGMPSATSGQSDERSAAAQQQGGKVYHLTADASTKLAPHVGHQIEVTGTLSAMSGGMGQHHGAASSSGYTGSTGSSATTSKGAAGAGSGSAGYTGQATSVSGATGSGAAGGTGTPGSTSQAGSSTASMAGMDHGKAAGMIRVTNVKMIASTCR